MTRSSGDYQRHETRQPEKLLEFLQRMEDDVGIDQRNCRVLMTGSGGNSLSGLVGAKFVQEVNAVSLAVERLHPEANSVIELGGQDAKIIVFKEDLHTGRKKKVPSMNDKCAGGTGAVIDKIVAKLKILRANFAIWAIQVSVCIMLPVNAACSPRPTSMGCRNRGSPPIS